MCFFLWGSFFITYSQAHDDLETFEKQLSKIAPIILYGTHDFHKYEANEKFSDLLWDALHLDRSYHYPFDSLKTISILQSPDNKFRIFTWNLQKADGSYDFFGMVQLNPRRADGEIVYQLDNNKNMPGRQAMQEVFSTENWYGAHYYKIIPSRYRGKWFYTLLGWDGNNLMTSRKIIDVLVFDNQGHPEFGAPVFITKDGVLQRYIIEYAAHVSVSLKYERHFLYDGRNRTWMIVFDRVAPLAPQLEGHYQFYVPETNIFDAFVFENGAWHLYEDVDARTDIKQRSRFRNARRVPSVFYNF